ncbi:MAG: hypothetical protein ABI318_12245 [Chthoniobacteraceae bacterium]
MPPRLLSLIQDLRLLAPHLSLDMRLLPSGVVFLNVHPGSRELVLEYSPGRGFGISELNDQTTPFDVGHEHVFDDAEPAAKCLLTLVSEALASPHSHAA